MIRRNSLGAVQVSALVAATPWPYNVLVHVAAWAGLRAGEIDGLTVGNVELPEPSINPKPRLNRATCESCKLRGLTARSWSTAR